MNKNQILLSTVHKTTQQCQTGIRSILDTAIHPQLRSILEQQLQEYESLETEACRIALQRGWDLPEMDTFLRFLTDRITRMQLSGRNSDSCIADILIRMNTKGMIQSLRELNRCPDKDPQIRILSQKLLDCENANIRQMQPFL